VFARDPSLRSDSFMPTFRATLVKVGPGYWVDVPASVVESLGRARHIPVTVRYAGDAHASTVTPGREGRGRVALHADVFRVAGFAVGDELEISLTLDRTPRTITVPPDLQRALKFRPAADTAWQSAAPSTRRVVIEQLNGVRTAETRTRRIEKLVEHFAEKAATRPKKK
jgi:hypothetical protein